MLKTLTAPGKNGKLQLYLFLKIGFASNNANAETMATTLNIFPVSWGSTHLLSIDMAIPYLQNDTSSFRTLGYRS